MRIEKEWQCLVEVMEFPLASDIHALSLPKIRATCSAIKRAVVFSHLVALSLLC